VARDEWKMKRLSRATSKKENQETKDEGGYGKMRKLISTSSIFSK